MPHLIVSNEFKLQINETILYTFLYSKDQFNHAMGYKKLLLYTRTIFRFIRVRILESHNFNHALNTRCFLQLKIS